MVAGRAPGGAGTGGGLAAVLEAVTPDEVRQVNGLHVTPAWLADELVALALDGLPTAGDRSEASWAAGPAGPGQQAEASWAVGPTVCDPACGGGAFLLSAARALHSRGVSRRQAVRHLWGADVDPVGLAAAEAALALWAGEPPPPGRLVVGDPLPVGRDLWPDAPAAGFGVVVGNPPFLNQLGRATVRSDELTRRLRRRFGSAVRPYTDTAWLFLLLACELAGPGGRVALVQPMSLVGARDAAVVRAALAERADLRHLWVEQRRSFAAGVKVCAPVLQVRHPTAGRSSAPEVPEVPGVPGVPDTVAAPGTPSITADPGEATGASGPPSPAIPVARGGPERAGPGGRAESPGTNAMRPGGPSGSVGGGVPGPAGERRVGFDSVAGGGSGGRAGSAGGGGPAARRWADLLADAMGIPAVDLAVGGPRLGDRATVLAGFRDEYYGLVPLVGEAADLATGAGGRPVDVTGSTDRGGLGGGDRQGDASGPPPRPLITCGVIDWGRSAWGRRPTRFAKRRWTAPVVDLGRLPVAPADPGTAELARDAARWVTRTAVPKVVVATQTRVVEVAVDEDGRWVPSVPALAVLPHDPDDLWPLAAALAAPTATVWLLRRAPETGLSRGALKVAAPDLTDLPLPGDRAAWKEATAAFRAYVGDPTPAGVDAYARAAAAAYAAPPSLVAWWRSRLREP